MRFEWKEAEMCDKKFKQWTVQVNDEGYRIFNVDGDGSKKFLEVTTGPYGNPLFTIEPDLAFAVPEALVYVNAKDEQVSPAEKIGGIVCQESDGTARYRFSLSNPKAPKFETVEDGIEISGERWYLAVLFSKDKNRTFNYDAFYVREKPAKVKLLELADLNFTQLL